MHKRGGRDTPVPLLCRVSCQQFCLHAKSHIFCVDFPGKLFGKLHLLFFVIFRSKTLKICPKEDQQEGGWAPHSVERSDLGQILPVLGRKNTKNNNTKPLKGPTLQTELLRRNHAQKGGDATGRSPFCAGFRANSSVCNVGPFKGFVLLFFMLFCIFLHSLGFLAERMVSERPRRRSLCFLRTPKIIWRFFPKSTFWYFLAAKNYFFHKVGPFKGFVLLFFVLFRPKTRKNCPKSDLSTEGEGF